MYRRITNKFPSDFSLLVTAKKKVGYDLPFFYGLVFQSDRGKRNKNQIARAKRAPKTEKNPSTRGPHRARKNHFHSNPRGLDRPRGRVVSIFFPRRECDFSLIDGKVYIPPTHFVLSVAKKCHLPRTKTSLVFCSSLRSTRRSRPARARPISRSVVASSSRSWRPTLSRTRAWWTGR